MVGDKLMNHLHLVTDTNKLIEVYEEAIKLAQSHGKKVGERFDEEFWEVAKQKGLVTQEIAKTEQDIDMITGNLRESGCKVINLNEEMRKKNHE